MTNKEKISAVDGAIILIENGLSDFICPALFESEHFELGQIVFDEIPEILKYKPDGAAHPLLVCRI